MDSASKQGQVTEQLDLIGNKTEGLHDLIGKLQERLSPITAKRPQADREEATEMSALVPLAETIRGHVLRIHAANESLEYLLSHLEL